MNGYNKLATWTVLITLLVNLSLTSGLNKERNIFRAIGVLRLCIIKYNVLIQNIGTLRKFVRATMFPRNFWFVSIQSDPVLGLNPSLPYVTSSKENDTKKPWKEVFLEGNVEDGM